MGISVFPEPSAASKTRRVVSITSGTSWTVPAGVTFVNVTTYGAGGGGGGVDFTIGTSGPGMPGEKRTSIVNTTPAASIAISIGAGGSGGPQYGGSAGGSTWFTGATTAAGGAGGRSSAGGGPVGTGGTDANNGGSSAARTSQGTAQGGDGGSGMIEIEYWVQEII